jgi:hypothetical protein
MLVNEVLIINMGLHCVYQRPRGANNMGFYGCVHGQ